MNLQRFDLLPVSKTCLITVLKELFGFSALMCLYNLSSNLALKTLFFRLKYINYVTESSFHKTNRFQYPFI